MVNGATVTTAEGDEQQIGVIHVLDIVLSPTNAYNDITQQHAARAFTHTLVAAFIQAELAETLHEAGSNRPSLRLMQDH